MQYNDRDRNHEENPNTGRLQTNQSHEGTDQKPQEQAWTANAPVRDPR